MTVTVGAATKFAVELTQTVRYLREFTLDEVIGMLAEDDDLLRQKLVKTTPETIGLLLIAAYDRQGFPIAALFDKLTDGEVLAEDFHVKLEVNAATI